MARIRIGDMLVKAGLIDDMQLQAALSQQRQWGGRIGDILIDKGFVDEMMLWRGLSKQLGVALVHIPDLGVAREVALSVPRELCEKNEIFPIGRTDRELTVATSNPQNIDGIDELGFRTGLKVKIVLAPPREIDWAVRHFHLGDKSPCPPPRERFRAELQGELKIVQSDKLVPGAMDSAPPAPSFAATAPGMPPTWQPPMPGGAPAMRHPTITPFSQVADVAPSPALNHSPLGDAEQSLREATNLLRAVIETCVAKGIFSREEYIERLKRLG